jgi:hypothetical protein
MPELTQEQLHELARLGAQARLAQLDDEIKAIRAAYPDLTGGPKRGRRTKTAREAASVAQAPAAPKARRRHRMSAAERKAVSERMRRYWAERRKAKGK